MLRVLTGKLWTYLADLNEQCVERRDFLMNQIMEQEGITEELKSRDQMEWVRQANNVELMEVVWVMNKIVCAMLCILLVFSLSACSGNVNEVNTQNVESEIYSEEDIAAAIDTIKKEFKSNWNGCTLTEIYYAGDDSSKDHQDWADRNNAD